MNKDEALKTALEAMDLARNCLKKADAFINHARIPYDRNNHKQWVELSVTDIDNITHKAISIVDAMLLTEETLKENNK